MKELESFFKNIERIANAMEKIEADNIKANEHINNVLSEVKSNIDKTMSNERIATDTQEPVIQTAQAVTNPIVQNVQPTGIPVSGQVQSYSQNQLALAMGRALDAGKMVEIQNILKEFNASSLMDITPDKYNDLALRLRSIGVEV